MDSTYSKISGSPTSRAEISKSIRDRRSRHGVRSRRGEAVPTEDGEAAHPALRSRQAAAASSSVASYGRRERRSLVTLSLVVIALAGMMIQGAEASQQACKVDADCGSVRGKASCVENSHGKSFCVYSSCSAGFFGGGNTYTECYECPADMTSVAGRAFMKTDCFLPCGDGRCYQPEDGYAECIVEAASASHVCLQTCNKDGYLVSNPGRSYATCIPDPNGRVVDQSAHAPIAVKMRLAQRSHTSPIVERTNPKLYQQKRQAGGRRLKYGSDLHFSGPAAAMLMEKDPLALLSR